MKKTLLFLTFLGTFLSLSAQNQPLNISFKSNFPYTDVLQAQKLNDIWGYVDQASGREYALVGLTTGFSIVDVSSNTLTEVARIDGPYSTWRDIKTWGNHAFVTHDSWYGGAPQALLVVDLSDITNGNAPYYSYTLGDTLNRSHNIYIDENGVAYLTGSNYGVGGALMLDVTDPNNIEFLGNYNDFYLHDCVTRGDTIWGGAINQGFLVSVDVSDKSNPVELGQITTPNLFTHNCWFSDDNQYVFTTDELTDSYLASYDVSDVANMQLLDQIQSFYSDLTIPHNTHYFDGYLVTSYYTDGLQIVDAQYPDNLVDVGHYDTAPNYEGDGYDGAWGAYPYLPSGKVLVTDMQEGLYVLDVNYTRAAYLHINVIDAVTGASIPNADFTFDNISEATNLEGKLKTGTPTAGTYTMTCSKSGYSLFSDTVTVTNNVIVERTIELDPDFGIGEFDDEFSVESFVNTAEVQINFPKDAFGENYNIFISGINGQLINRVEIKDVQSKSTTLELPSTEGSYVVSIYQGAQLKHSANIVKL